MKGGRDILAGGHRGSRSSLSPGGGNQDDVSKLWRKLHIAMNLSMTLHDYKEGPARDQPVRGAGYESSTSLEKQ